MFVPRDRVACSSSCLDFHRIRGIRSRSFNHSILKTSFRLLCYPTQDNEASLFVALGRKPFGISSHPSKHFCEPRRQILKHKLPSLFCALLVYPSLNRMVWPIPPSIEPLLEEGWKSSFSCYWKTRGLTQPSKVVSLINPSFGSDSPRNFNMLPPRVLSFVTRINVEMHNSDSFRDISH